MKYTVKNATASYFPAIANAESEIFSAPWSESDIASYSSNRIILVAACDTQLFGYVIGSIAADEGEILRLGVSPEYRGFGIGKALLTAVITVLRNKKARAIFLEVRESNKPARALYRSFGFMECGKRKKYYHSPDEDAVLMLLET